MVWPVWVFQIIIAVVSFLLSPKPKSPSVTASPVEMPVVETGTPIPVIFGTVWLKDPHIVWYGDVRTEAIKTKSGK